MNRYMAHVLRSGIALDFGCEAVALLLSVALTEDKTRYTKPVLFWNDQLTAYLGCRVDRLNVIRKRLVDAGWLHYEPGRKSVAGRYWVLVPGGDEQLNDSALGDNAVETPAADFPHGKAHTKADDKAHRKAEDNPDTKTHHKPSPFIPIPFPIPEPIKEPPTPLKGEGSAGTASATNGKPRGRTKPPPFDPSSVEIPAALDSPPFRDAWQKWQRHRRDIRKPLTETQTREQLDKLAGWGPDRALKSLSDSITYGWQSFFEPNTEGNHRGKPSTSIGPGQRYTPGEELGEL